MYWEPVSKMAYGSFRTEKAFSEENRIACKGFDQKKSSFICKVIVVKLESVFCCTLLSSGSPKSMNDESWVEYPWKPNEYLGEGIF